MSMGTNGALAVDRLLSTAMAADLAGRDPFWQANFPDAAGKGLPMNAVRCHRRPPGSSTMVAEEGRKAAPRLVLSDLEFIDIVLSPRKIGGAKEMK
jgi:hypothetical protein